MANLNREKHYERWPLMRLKMTFLLFLHGDKIECGECLIQDLTGVFQDSEHGVCRFQHLFRATVLFYLPLTLCGQLQKYSKNTDQILGSHNHPKYCLCIGKILMALIFLHLKKCMTFLMFGLNQEHLGTLSCKRDLRDTQLICI